MKIEVTGTRQRSKRCFKTYARVSLESGDVVKTPQNEDHKITDWEVGEYTARRITRKDGSASSSVPWIVIIGYNVYRIFV